jgi:hypothetical protein
LHWVHFLNVFLKEAGPEDSERKTFTIGTHSRHISTKKDQAVIILHRLG